MTTLIDNQYVAINMDRFSNTVYSRYIAVVYIQCLRNYIGTRSAFADVSYLMANVDAKFYV